MADEAVSTRVLTVPNALSVLRLLLVPVFAWLILSSHDLWALVVLISSSASDFLDGYLARRWHQVTRLGQILDPAADRLYIFTTLLGLAWRGLMPWWFVLVIVARDVVLLSAVPLLARQGHRPLPVHHLGKVATFALLYAFPLILLSALGGGGWGTPRGSWAGPSPGGVPGCTGGPGSCTCARSRPWCGHRAR